MAHYVLGERAAEAVKNLMRGSSSVVLGSKNQTANVDYQAYQAPWSIEWAKSEDNGTGAWIIYLPAQSFKDTTAEMDAAFSTMRTNMDNCDKYPQPWKRLGVQVGQGEVVIYLIFSKSASVSMHLSTNSASGDDVSVPIAAVSRDATSGEVKIKQFQIGEMVVSNVFGGSSGEETYVEPIIDIDFDFVEDGSYNRKLVATLTRRRIFVSRCIPVDDEDKDVTSVTKITLVSDSNYDVSTHQFVNTMKKVTVLDVDNDNDDLVFQATPHSAEHGS